MNLLNVSDSIWFKTIRLDKWEKYETKWSEIITVVSWTIWEILKWKIKTFESSVYHQWEIRALEDSFLTVFDIKDNDIILNRIDVDQKYWFFCRENWKQLRELYDVDGLEKVDLYRWDQIEEEYNGVRYKLNLWFCWKQVDCLWHNQHNFIEVHTNIAWDWYMQKSIDGTDEGLFETVWLLPWNSHRRFDIKWEKEENGDPKYPFHRWLGGTSGNIWLVIEKY